MPPTALGIAVGGRISALANVYIYFNATLIDSGAIRVAHRSDTVRTRSFSPGNSILARTAKNATAEVPFMGKVLDSLVVPNVHNIHDGDLLPVRHKAIHKGTSSAEGAKNSLYVSRQKAEAGITFLLEYLGALWGVLKQFTGRDLKMWLPLVGALYIINQFTSSLSTTSLFATVCVAMAPLVKLAVINSNLNLKIAVHHFIRDSGLFRTLMDTLVVLGLPALAFQYPSLLPDFFRLGSLCTRIQYGKDSPKSQVIYMYLPTSSARPRGMVFFVHGGAWGSGSPIMYRLLAKPFLEHTIATAVVGYRTYPDGDALAQVDDLELAAAKLAKLYPDLCMGETELGVTVMGHSSGSHLAGVMIVERLRKQMQSNRFNLRSSGHSMRIDSFIGISGPYDIASHFQFEASRGVEELSPMQPACRGKHQFHRHSPALQLQQLLCQRTKEEVRIIDAGFPSVALLHGLNDDTVPAESTRQATKAIRSAGLTKHQDFYFYGIGHTETMLELMFGGKTQDAIFDWLEAKAKTVQRKFSEGDVIPMLAYCYVEQVLAEVLIGSDRLVRRTGTLQHFLWW